MAGWTRAQGFVAIVAGCASFLSSRPAAATVGPRCGSAYAAAAPLPVAAGQAAILFIASGSATTYDLHWFDPAGAEIAFDRTNTTDYQHLRPRVAVAAGNHKLVYTDDCSTEPIDLPLDFEVAPPPPAGIGTVDVSYDPYCPDDPRFKFAPDWPPPVGVTLTLDPALVPYAPVLWIDLSDDTGGLQTSAWAAPITDSTGAIHASRMIGCEGVSPSVPPGVRSFTAVGTLVDGPPVTPAIRTTPLDCPYCPDPTSSSVPVSTKPPTTPLAAPAGDTGCGVAAPGHATGGAAWMLALLGATRRRSRRAISRARPRRRSDQSARSEHRPSRNRRT